MLFDGHGDPDSDLNWFLIVNVHISLELFAIRQFSILPGVCHFYQEIGLFAILCYWTLTQLTLLEEPVCVRVLSINLYPLREQLLDVVIVGFALHLGLGDYD